MAPRRPPTSLLPPLEPMGRGLCPSVADGLPHPPTQGCRHQGRGSPLTPDVRPGALTPWRSLSQAWDPPRGGQLLGGQAEPQAPSSAFHAHAFVHLRPPPSRDKFNQQLLWPPEGPRCAAGWRGSGRPLPRPRGCRAEFRTRHRPVPDDSGEPGPRSPAHFFSEPQLTLSTSSFQSCRDHNRTGQQGREGAAVSRGGERRWGAAVPQSPGPCPSSQDPAPTSSHPSTLPNVPPTTPPGAEAGGEAWCEREGGSDITVHPAPHATCGEGAQPAGKSCLGFSYRQAPRLGLGSPGRPSVPHPTLTLC